MQRCQLCAPGHSQQSNLEVYKLHPQDPCHSIVTAVHAACCHVQSWRLQVLHPDKTTRIQIHSMSYHDFGQHKCTLQFETQRLICTTTIKFEPCFNHQPVSTVSQPLIPTLVVKLHITTSFTSPGHEYQQSQCSVLCSCSLHPVAVSSYKLLVRLPLLTH